MSSSIKLETQSLKTAPGVSLSESQSTLTRSILDLFAGRPSLPKLSLWADDATFVDPLTASQGRKQFSAQWYGLQAAFSEIERLDHLVKDAGNPIVLELKTRYKVAGIGMEKVIESIVEITTDDKGEKITKVADKWNGSIPDGTIALVSFDLFLRFLPLFQITDFCGDSGPATAQRQLCPAHGQCAAERRRRCQAWQRLVQSRSFMACFSNSQYLVLEPRDVDNLYPAAV